MSGDELSNDKQTVHLGIKRTVAGNVNVDEKIALGRKAAYSLFGAGLHSGNGLKQSICAKLWSSEIVPRMTYGLETLDVKQNQMCKLEAFQRKCLKQIQGLPDKAPNSSVLALLGIAPVEIIIHKTQLTLFGKIIRNQGSVEYEIAVRQLAMKSISEHSWFNSIKALLLKYNLPSAYQLLTNPPSKLEWKKSVNSALYGEVCEGWCEDVSVKSSLKYINPTSLRVGIPHPIWGTVRDNVHDSRRAQLKCRILTGTYNLQSNRAVFNQYRIDPTCKLCCGQPETRQHFLAECDALVPERVRFLQQISTITHDLI